MLNKRGLGGLARTIWFAVVMIVIILVELGYGVGWLYGFDQWLQILINIGLFILGFVYLFSRGAGSSRAFSIIFGILCLVLAIFGSIVFLGPFIMQIPVLGPLIVQSPLTGVFGIGSWWRIIFLGVIIGYFFFKGHPRVAVPVNI